MLLYRPLGNKGEKEMKKIYTTIQIIFFLSLLPLLFVSCGGPSEVISWSEATGNINSEWEAWKSKIKNLFLENFEEYWTREEAPHWKYGTYSNTGIEGDVILSLPDLLSPQGIWESKTLNCHRFAKLMVAVRGGLYIHFRDLRYPGDIRHAVYIEYYKDEFWMIDQGITRNLKIHSLGELEQGLNNIDYLEGICDIEIGEWEN
jgi:hypothetical protein